MTTWTAYIVAARPEESTDPDIGHDELEDLTDELAEHSAAVGGGGGRCSAQFDVTGSEHPPFGQAIEIFMEAAAVAGLPPWPLVTVEMCTVDEQERQLAEPTIPELVGVAETAEILGVTRQRVSELYQADRLPPPVATLASGPVWIADQVRAFVGRWRRKPGRPPKDPSQHSAA